MEKQLSEALNENKAMELEDSSVRRTLSEGNHAIESAKVQYISRDNAAMQEELIQQVIQTQHQLGISFGRALLLITRMNMTGQSKSSQKRPGNVLLDHIYIEWNNSQLQAQTDGKQCLLCLEDLRDEDQWEEIKEDEEDDVQILEQQPGRGGVDGIKQKVEIKDISNGLVIIDKDSVISINSKSNLEISDESQEDLNIIVCEMDRTDKIIGFIDLETLQKHQEDLEKDKKIQQVQLKESQISKQEKISGDIKDKSNSNSDKEKIIDQQLNGAVLDDQKDEKPIPLMLKKKKYALGCRHFFCGNCFESYIKAIFKEGSSCIYKTCPLDGCLERLGRDDFKHFLTTKQLQIYDKFIFTSMLQSSDTVKRQNQMTNGLTKFFIFSQAIQCPASGCSLVQVASTDAQTLKHRQESIICQCSHEYCNLCREISHFPSDCQEFRKWLTKLEIEGVGSLNDQWIIMNTKPCPKCNVNIEKNQGCLHMTCKPCGHHFCWMCLGEWKSHTDYYNCTKFDAAKIKEQENKKKELSRFRFHSGHYDTHQANVIAVKHEISELFQGISNVNSQLQANGMKPIETKNIRQFCDLILKARKYLPYLYAKGYFITEPEKLEFFNNLLEDYVRILDIYNRNLENFIRIIETTTPRLTIKTSFYMALHSLPKKINSLEKYISRQIYQFTKGLEHLEQTKKRTVTSIPENINAIFEMKKKKVAAKEKEKAILEKKKQKLSEKEQEKELNNQQKNQITIFIDSDSDDDEEKNEQIANKSVVFDVKSSLSNSEQREVDKITKKQDNQVVLRKTETTKTITDQFSGSQQTQQIWKRFSEYTSFVEKLLGTSENEEIEESNDELEDLRTKQRRQQLKLEQLVMKRNLLKKCKKDEKILDSEEEEEEAEAETAVIGVSKGNSKNERIGMEHKKNKEIQRKKIKLEEEEEEDEDIGENVYKICSDCKNRPIENEYGVCEKCFEKLYE